jgi:hypothetical protein
MKKPSLRVSKWMDDIPIEIECTACMGEWKFRVASGRPNQKEYQEKLQNAFNGHAKEVHKRDAKLVP